MSPSSSRRDLLRMLALGAGGCAFAPKASAFPLPLGGIARSVMTATGAPKRIIFIDIPNGVTPSASGYDDFASAGPTPSQFKLGVLTQPLEPLRDELVILDNLEMKNAAGDTHFGGIKALLTGRWPHPAADGSQGKGAASHISIDLYLAEKLGKLLTPEFPSINLGVQTHSITRSYRMDGSGVSPNQDPYDVYKRLFSTVTDGAPDPALMHRLQRRQSVLDSVSRDLTSFRARLTGRDRERADAQLEAIRTLEERLAAQMDGQVSSCTKPTHPAGLNPTETTGVDFPQLARMQIDNLVAAFACDRTRVAAMLWRGREYAVFKCGWAGMNLPGESFHGLSHDVTNDGYASFKKGKAFMFGLAAELALKLKSIPEHDGNMLDNTIIFIGSEIGRSHTNAGLQFCTIGGKNLGVNRGRYMRLGGAREPGQGVAHNRLLVSFLQAMGLPDQTFGESAGTGSGPLPGYLVT